MELRLIMEKGQEEETEEHSVESETAEGNKKKRTSEQHTKTNCSNDSIRPPSVMLVTIKLRGHDEDD